MCVQTSSTSNDIRYSRYKYWRNIRGNLLVTWLHMYKVKSHCLYLNCCLLTFTKGVTSRWYFLPPFNLNKPMHIFLANSEKRIKGKRDRLGYNNGQIALPDHWKILGLGYRKLICCIVLVFSVFRCSCTADGVSHRHPICFCPGCAKVAALCARPGWRDWTTNRSDVGPETLNGTRTNNEIKNVINLNWFLPLNNVVSVLGQAIGIQAFKCSITFKHPGCR